MKKTIKVTEEKEVDIKYLNVKAEVRYWDDANINGKQFDESGIGFPCRIKDCWCLCIDVDTGIIIGWPQGTTADVHFKICDAGVYSIADPEHNMIKEIDGYVPDIMCPKSEGYGDYIIMDIDENGKIDKWKPTFDEFFSEE